MATYITGEQAMKKQKAGVVPKVKNSTVNAGSVVKVKEPTSNSNYTQDSSGKWYDKTTGEPLGTGGTNADWSSKQGTYSSKGTSETSKNLYGTYESDLDRLTAAQRQAQVDQLKAARTKALANLDVQEQAIKPMYENARNQTSAASQQGARSFAEYLANRGLTNSGAAAQGEINRLSQLNNNLGNLNTAEANAYRDIANQRTQVENDYAAGLANANNAITTNYYNNLLNYNQAQRQYLQGLQERALGQYANDYQAYMNTLNPNSVEYWQAAARRGDKSEGLYNAGQQNALASIQAGNINYNNAAQMGWTVPQAQAYLDNYNQALEAQALQDAEDRAYSREQDEFNRNYKLAQLENETKKVNWQTSVPKGTRNTKTPTNDNPVFSDDDIVTLIDRATKQGMTSEEAIEEYGGLMTENQYIRARLGLIKGSD